MPFMHRFPSPWCGSFRAGGIPVGAQVLRIGWIIGDFEDVAFVRAGVGAGKRVWEG